MDNAAVMVFGAGGHAKVVIRTLELTGYKIAGVFDDAPAKHGQTVLGYTVLGGLEEALSLKCSRALLAIGDNATRQRIAKRFPIMDWVTAVHPRAWVDPSVVLGAGTIVFAGVVIQADTVIGKHAIINTSASIDHDCILGDFTHIAPGAHLAGEVTVGEGSFVGTGGVVVPGKRIGDWTIIGAGGVVIEDIPSRVIARGVPARSKKLLEDK